MLWYMRQRALLVSLALLIVSSGLVFAGPDTTPPSAPLVTWYEWQLATDHMGGSWAASDPESGIAGYEYSLGWSPGGTEVCGPTWTTLDTVDVSGLSLDHTHTYYWSVRAKNGAGLWGPCGHSGGTVVPIELTRIAQAKEYPDGTYVYLQNKLSSASLPSYGSIPASSYIQESDRSAGVGIAYAGIEGTHASVVGCLTTRYAERSLTLFDGAFVETTDTAAPLAMTNGELAGAARNVYEGQVPGARGANNVGLLVKTTGKVLWRDAVTCFIDDGSKLNDGIKPGLMVIFDSTGILPPPVGSYVAVTGVSCLTTLAMVPIRMLRPRRQSDIVPVATPVAYIYDSDLATANSFKGFLDSEGMPTDLISIGAAATAEFGKYCLIIAGWDSGNLAGWGTTATVDHIKSYEKPILGIETGGLSLFQQIGGLHYIASTAAFAQGCLMDVSDPTNMVYALPYAISFDPAAPTIKITDNPSCWYGFNTFSPVPAGVTPLGNKPGSPNDSVFGWESPRYVYWGFRDKADLLTTEGKHLFINAAWYAIWH